MLGVSICFLKLYNYFCARLSTFFLLICIPYSLVTNPELIEDEVDFLFLCYRICYNTFVLCGMELYL